MNKRKNNVVRHLGYTLLTLAMLTVCLAMQATAATPGYDSALKLGRSAGEQAKNILGDDWSTDGTIVITNAGYAMPNDHSTRGCMDGISELTGAKVGASTLVNLQSRFDQPLWFAVFVPESGKCAYIEYDHASASSALSGQSPESSQPTTKQVARIDAEYLFAHPDEFSAQLKKSLFGNNVFRIVTTANAVALQCRSEVLKAIQVHDHFCPGVTSGVVLANYIRHNLLPSESTKCFILSLKPWCKEDALTTLLNATPGKGGYAVFYPAKDQASTWAAPLDRACSIVFTKHKDKPWRGHVLGFDFNQAKAAYGTKSYGNMVLDKLHADIWFLNNMDKAEGMVESLKEFELAPGKSPKELLQPGTELLEIMSKK